MVSPPPDLSFRDEYHLFKGILKAIHQTATMDCWFWSSRNDQWVHYPWNSDHGYTSVQFLSLREISGKCCETGSLSFCKCSKLSELDRPVASMQLRVLCNRNVDSSLKSNLRFRGIMGDENFVWEYALRWGACYARSFVSTSWGYSICMCLEFSIKQISLKLRFITLARFWDLWMKELRQHFAINSIWYRR